jgi:hypothetical protein
VDSKYSAFVMQWVEMPPLDRATELAKKVVGCLGIKNWV